MADGKEEREQQKAREEELKKKRGKQDDRYDYEPPDRGEPERGGS